jgi:hypothetical protein
MHLPIYATGTVRAELILAATVALIIAGFATYMVLDP